MIIDAAASREKEYREQVLSSEKVIFHGYRQQRQKPLSAPEINAFKKKVSIYLESAARAAGKERFIYTDENKTFLNAACHYFCGHRGVSNLPLNTDKGLFVYGLRGVGKTIMMEALSTAAAGLDSGFALVPCKQIENECRLAQSTEPAGRHKSGSNCFDDLGEDEPFSLYGAQFDPLKELLTSAYQRWQKGGVITHVTTNLPIDEFTRTSESVKERYGDRIESRIFEMFNFVNLDGVDYRRL